jgi:hypothetical protein
MFVNISQIKEDQTLSTRCYDAHIISCASYYCYSFLPTVLFSLIIPPSGDQGVRIRMRYLDYLCRLHAVPHGQMEGFVDGR